MARLIAPFDPEAEIRLVKGLPPSISTQNLVFLLSMFFYSFQRGFDAGDYVSRYARALIEKYSLSPDFVLPLIERIRGFDFNQNPALIVDELDRSIWCGRFSSLMNYDLLTPLEIKRVTSQPWWNELESSLFSWYLSADDEGDEDEDL
jgi:hypothetical protein